MWIARDVARRFLATYGLRPPVTEEQIDRVFRARRVCVLSFPRWWPIREFRHGQIIGVRSDLGGADRFQAKLHALGHIEMHCGDQFIVDGVVVGRQERQANEFAAYLLAGEAALVALDVGYRIGASAEQVVSWLAS